MKILKKDKKADVNPMAKETKIKVDQALSKIIGETICKEIKNSRVSNGKVYERAKRCENQYNQITRWMEEGKTCDSPWPGAADYFVPMTEWIVDAVWARIIRILFSQEPYMTAKGTESSDIPKENGVTDFVDMAFRELVGLYDSTTFFFKQMIKLPGAILKYAPVYEFDRVIKMEDVHVFTSPDGKFEEILMDDEPDAEMKALEFQANGYSYEKKPYFVSEDKAIQNGPLIEYIKFDDYVWAHTAKRGKRLYYEGDRFFQTVNDLHMKKQQGFYDAEAVDAIYTKTLGEGMSGAEAVVKQRSQLLECYNWYGRLPFNNNNQIDFESPDTVEQEVHCVVEMKFTKLLSINHWEHAREPHPKRVYLHGLFEETEEFWGRSLPEKLYMTQKELNTFHNTIMNNAMIAMQKIFVKRKTLTGDEWENPQVYPGAIWEEDTPGDIRMLEVGDVKSIGFELEASFINFAERISNISLYQTGTARQGGQKTKGEVDRTVHEGDIGLGKFVKRCHNIMVELCKWTVSYYGQHMPPGLERRISGEDGQQVFPVQENMQQYEQQGVEPFWSEEDLTGKFDFTWNGTLLSGNKERELAIQNDMEERYLPHPLIAGSLLATWEILREGMIIRGKQWEKYLPPREAILKEMEQMKQQAEADRQKKASGDQVDSKAVEAAVAKGVPQDQAIQILAKLKGGQGAQPAQNTGK